MCFFFKQKTAYEMRISDWSSDVCSSDLDHLGVQPDGTVMYGANDDASGTTAVIEIARALAAGKQPKRSILFVCYGSEEIGLYGSTYFGAHPPVPLDRLVANIAFEMIAATDPTKNGRASGGERGDPKV